VQTEDEMVAARLRRLPQVQRLLEEPQAGELLGLFGRAAVVAALRVTLDQSRVLLRDGLAEPPPPERLLQSARSWLVERARPTLRRVINATGIVLHTNLGRAPLAEEAVAAAGQAAASYANLEFDLVEGRRGARAGGVEALLCALTGAEAALAVNNGAAAILLGLAALAAGGDVLVSRGELVEIGGGFRIPDVIRQGGARLVEVGSTNKTRLADYRAAITPQTRALLKVHQSNFRMVGFTAEASIGELAGLARECGLVVVADLGSGNLADLAGLGRGAEPTVQEAVAARADLVTFSGDKLLGGPQAGLLAGTRAALEPIRRHPLLRAVRLDKMSLAALEATLILHRDAPERIPVLRMLGQSEGVLDGRAQRLAARLGSGAAVIRTEGYAGGGALPEERIPSRAVALPAVTADQLARRLRLQRPAVVGRIVDGRFALDVLTIAEAELDEVAAAVAAVSA